MFYTSQRISSLAAKDDGQIFDSVTYFFHGPRNLF